MMKIGDLELEAGAPDAERLLASTGLSVAEMRAHLASTRMPSLVARALHACVAEGTAVADLARRIAAEGVEAVRGEVLKLYAEAETLVLEAEAQVKKVARGKNGR